MPLSTPHLSSSQFCRLFCIYSFSFKKSTNLKKIVSHWKSWCVGCGFKDLTRKYVIVICFLGLRDFRTNLFFLMIIMKRHRSTMVASGATRKYGWSLICFTTIIMTIIIIMPCHCSTIVVLINVMLSALLQLLISGPTNSRDPYKRAQLAFQPLLKWTHSTTPNTEAATTPSPTPTLTYAQWVT